MPKKLQKTCEQCGNGFYVAYAGRRRRFCGDVCALDYIKTQGLPPKEKTKKPHRFVNGLKVLL